MTGRWLAVWVAVLALGAAAVLVLVTQAPASGSVDEQARRLAAELRCPDCESLSVAESRTASAVAIREEIAAQLAAGRTPDEVRASFVARYGEWILLEPRGAPLWLVAPLGALAGLALLGWWLSGRRSGSPGVTDRLEPMPTDPERARIAREVEQLDG